MDAMKRFDQCVYPEPNTGCFLWGGQLRQGYGRFFVGSRTDGTRRLVTAHRFAWEQLHGPVPDGKELCHKCDVRECVNPDHLYLGTRQDNMTDMARRERGKGGRGKSGAVGVSVRRQGYQAYIDQCGKRRHLGTFASRSEAISAVVLARKAIYG